MEWIEAKARFCNTKTLGDTYGAASFAKFNRIEPYPTGPAYQRYNRLFQSSLMIWIGIVFDAFVSTGKYWETAHTIVADPTSSGYAAEHRFALLHLRGSMHWRL